MSAITAVGALGGGGLNVSAGFAALPPQPGPTLSSAPSAVGFPTQFGPPATQQAAPANVVLAPEQVAASSFGASPPAGGAWAAGVPLPPDGLTTSVSVHAAAPPDPSPAAADKLPGYVKDMVQGLQSKFGEMQSMISAPISIPSFPGGQELAESLRDSLHAQWSMMQLEIGMAQADQIRGTAKTVTDKITEMKD